MQSETADGRSVQSRWPAWSGFLIGTVIALPFVLTLGLNNLVSYDEDQHIAAGVLFARDGLLPYRDFAYFHVPYLIYAYGLLFKFTDQYLLAARLFSAVCAALTCGAIFSAAWRLFETRPSRQRLLIGTGAVVLVISTPLFFHTVGHAWNQEPAVFCAVLAFLGVHGALERTSPGARLLWSGVVLGLGIGFRITVAPLVLPFAVMIWLVGSAARERLRHLACFAAGLALALCPVVWAGLAAPEGFVFGNIEFPRVNIDYRLASTKTHTVSLLDKLSAAFEWFVRGSNWALLYGLIAAWLTAWIRPPAPRRSWPRLFFFLLLTLPFLLLGAFAPSPFAKQYFYPLVPFLALGALCLFAGVPPHLNRLRWMWRFAAVLVLISALRTGSKYSTLRDIADASQWHVSRLRQEAIHLRQLVPDGPILTLSPTPPLEAGLRIYPEFATGAFAWRVAPFVPRARHTALRLVAPEYLEARFASDPPAAILLGFRESWEKPLLRYARDHGYHRTVFLKDKELWLAPDGMMRSQLAQNDAALFWNKTFK